MERLAFLFFLVSLVRSSLLLATPAGIPVSGQVLDAAGKPLRGATTGANGKAVAPVVEGERRIVLEKGGSAFGRVVDSREQPVAGARVRLAFFPEAEDLRQRQSADEIPLFAAVTDAEGRFDLEARAQGHPPVVDREDRHRAAGERRSHAMRRLVLFTLVWLLGVAPADAAGTPVEDVAIQLIPRVDSILASGFLPVMAFDAGQRERAAFGFVKDLREKPVAGARVKLRPVPEAGSDELLAETDAAGRFEIGRLGAGRYDLEARAPGFAPVMVRGVKVAGKAGARIDLGTVLLPPGATVEGTVADPEGTPVEGARIEVFLPEQRRSFVPDGDIPLATGPDGRFAVSGLRQGERIDLRAWKEGYIPGSARAVEVPAPGPVRIVLDPGVRVPGRVVAEDGQPIPDAKVLVLGGTGLSRRQMAEVQTDAAGRFEAAGIEPGSLLLRATARGYVAGEAHVEALAGQGVEEVRIALRLGAVITGRVLGPDGDPVAGAVVRASTTGLEASLSPFEEESARTDGDGAYRLEGIAEGRRSITAEHRDFQRATRDLDVQPGENRLDLRLGRGFPVTGRVVDPAGQPVAGARVTLSTPSVSVGGDEAQAAESLADGSFRSPSVPSGAYLARAAKEGFSPAEPTERIHVAGVPVAGLELRLGSVGFIRGHLRGLDFDELARVEIDAHRLDASGLPLAWRQGRVDFEGAYEVGGVTPGEWRVKARQGGTSAQGRVSFPKGATEVTLDLEMGGGLTLSGRVLRAGAPVPGITVSAENRETGGRTTTGSQGEFRIAGLEPETYRIDVTDRQKGIRHQETVDLSADRDVVIEIPGQRVKGQVLDAGDSAPVTGVTVVLLWPAGSDAGGLPPSSTSGGDGSFTASNVPAGIWRVLAVKDGYATAETTIEVLPGSDVEGVRIELSPAARLVLEVRTAMGVPPAEVFATLLEASDNPVAGGQYPTGEGGRVLIGNAPSGRFRLLVAAEGTATVSLDVALPSEAPIPLFLPPPSQLAVRVPALATEGLLGTISVTGLDGRPFLSTFAPILRERQVEQGNAVVRDLPPGTWTIRVTAADGRSWEGTATTTGGRTEIVLE